MHDLEKEVLEMEIHNLTAELKVRERRERHLKMRLYAEVRRDTPMTAETHPRDVEHFMDNLEREIGSCSTCCKKS